MFAPSTDQSLYNKPFPGAEIFIPQIAAALKAGFEDIAKLHDQLGTAGQEKSALNRFGEQAVRLDVEAEEILIGKVAVLGYSFRLASEEHGELIFGTNPQFTLIVDGVDGSNAYLSNLGVERYGTMGGVLLGVNPRYDDYLVTGFSLLSPRKEIFLATKDRGAVRIDECGETRLNLSRGPVVPEENLQIVKVDPEPSVSKLVNFERLNGFNGSMMKSMAVCYADILQRNIDFFVDWTRKGNLEQAIAFGLLKEAGTAIVTLDGESIGKQHYFEFGRDKKIPLITVSDLSQCDRVLEFVAQPLKTEPGFVRAKEYYELPKLAWHTTYYDTRGFIPERWYSRYKNLYPDLVELADIIGVHAKSGDRFFYNPFLGTTAKNNFSNIYDHLVFVARTFRALAEPLIEAGVITEKEARNGERRAFLHDIVKPYEVFLSNAEKAGIIDTATFLDERVFLAIEDALVNRVGLDHKTAHALVFDCGQETGGRPSALKLFIKTDHSGLAGVVEGDWVKKLVHMADDLCSSTMPDKIYPVKNMILTLEERMCMFDAFQKYKLGWRAGFAINANNELAEAKSIYYLPEESRPIGSFHAIMVWLENKLCRDYVSLIGLKSGGNPQLQVKELVTDALIQS